MSLPPPDPAHDAGLDVPVDATPPSAGTSASDGAKPAARPGDLVAAWRLMLGLAWTSAFFAYAGVWQASVQIGISTWWIGPRAQPTNIAIKLIPFYLSLVVGLLVVYNVKWVVRWSAVGVLAAALISIPDFSRSIGLGVAESIIAGLLGVVTLASLTGRYRAPKSQPALDDGPPPPPPPPTEPASHDPGAQ